MHRLLCVLCGLFLGLGPAIAQSPDFKAFDLENSKDIPQVLSIAQDDFNHLYFGTKKGLFHYNGVACELVQLNDSVNEVEVTALTNANGHIWVGTSEGAVYEVDLLSSVVNDKITNALNAQVNSIAVHDNMMAIATYGQGVFIVRSDTLIQIQVEDGLPDDYTYDVLFHDGRLWVGTDGGIAELDLVSLSCEVHSMRNGLPDNIVQSLAIWDDHSIAVGMYDFGVCFLDTRTYEFRIEFSAEHPWRHGVIQDMCRSDDGLLWIATKDAGIVTLSESVDGLNWRIYSEINGITSNRTYAVYSDAEHNIWIGTRKGLTFYKGSGIEYLLSNEGLIGPNIYDVLVDQDRNLWLASESGVVKYSHNQNGAEIIEMILQNDEDKSLQIVSLFEGSDGTIYMGSLGSGLITYQQERGVERIGEREGLFNPNIMDITEDLKGRIWLATLGDGVFKLEGGRAVQIEETKGLASNYIYCLSIDDEQRLWIGSDGGGVGIYDCYEEYWIPSMVEEFSDATVYSIAHAGNGDVWFATEKMGLFKLDDGVLSRVGAEMGLRSSEILGLESSYSGGIVAMHTMGLDYLALGSTSFKPFTIEKDGFSFEPNLNALHAMHRDDVWVGSMNGAVKVNIDQERHESLTPNVSITNLRVLYESRELIEKYEYSYGENHFIFDFLAIWMKAPEMIRYQYMLEGFDKQWSFETESRAATYSSLPPGNYTFYVRASNENGGWSAPSRSSYSFTILKPFWMEWWFYTLIISVFAGGVFAFVRFRTKRLLFEKRLLEREVDRRTEEIRSQKDIIQHKSEEILSSITYAKRIQSAILPTDEIIHSYLKDSFVLYKPKDIVAGDFYWFEALPAESKILFAAADCTGHGVPGAMVSVVCSTALERSVREFNRFTPAAVLDKTLELVVSRFEHTQRSGKAMHDTIKDGMDIALFSVEPQKEDGGAVIEYAGAHNPLWVISKRKIISLTSGELSEAVLEAEGFFLHEIKADKQPIGMYAESKAFTNHRLTLESGDTFYAFTDGYADQFGGDRGKKFKYKPFKQLLLSLQSYGMQEQRKRLDDHFEMWRGDLEQVDDVCVVGVKV